MFPYSAVLEAADDHPHRLVKRCEHPGKLLPVAVKVNVRGDVLCGHLDRAMNLLEGHIHEEWLAGVMLTKDLQHPLGIYRRRVYQVGKTGG